MYTKFYGFFFKKIKIFIHLNLWVLLTSVLNVLFKQHMTNIFFFFEEVKQIY